MAQQNGGFPELHRQLDREVDECARLVEFPGGVLELTGDGDEDIGSCGAFLQFHPTIALDYEQYGGAVMRYKPTCLGYLRTDVSGIGQLWDESQIRALAVRLGYDLAGIVVYDPASGRPPLARLRIQANRLDSEAVIVPGTDHFANDRVPAALMRQLDVITVSPEATYARRASPLPPQCGMQP